MRQRSALASNWHHLALSSQRIGTKVAEIAAEGRHPDARDARRRAERRHGAVAERLRERERSGGHLVLVFVVVQWDIATRDRGVREKAVAAVDAAVKGDGGTWRCHDFEFRSWKVAGSHHAMKIPDTFTVYVDRLLRHANLNTSHGALRWWWLGGTLIQLAMEYFR